MKRKVSFDANAEKRLTIFMQTLGNTLYLLRKSRKESLKAVAKAVKISPSFLSKIEKGTTLRLDQEVFYDLCKHYQTTPYIVLSNLTPKGNARFDEVYRKKIMGFQIVGLTFYRCRKSRGESIKAVAKAINISTALLSKIEKGRYWSLTMGTIFDLCKHYDKRFYDIAKELDNL